MYKSSPLTFVFKFIFPVFMLVGVTSALYTLWKEGTPESLGHAKATGLLAIWVSIFLFQMLFRLKNIKTTEKGIIIDSFGKQEIVDYKDMEWITRYDFSCLYGLTIKYHNKVTGEYKKVSFMLSQRSFGFFADDAMTEFIKRKIIEENSNYSKDSQPPQIRNFAIIMSLGFSIALVAFYFMDVL